MGGFPALPLPLVRLHSSANSPKPCGDGLEIVDAEHYLVLRVCRYFIPWDYRNMTMYTPTAGEYRWPASFLLRMQFDKKSMFRIPFRELAKLKAQARWLFAPLLESVRSLTAARVLLAAGRARKGHSARAGQRVARHCLQGVRLFLPRLLVWCRRLLVDVCVLVQEFDDRIRHGHAACQSVSL